MGKEVKGWRDKREWEKDTSEDGMLAPFMAAFSSDDGWYCPHCNAKYTMQDVNCGEGVTNEEYFQLMEECEPLEMMCDQCSDPYYLECVVVRKFHSCKDKEF